MKKAFFPDLNGHLRHTTRAVITSQCLPISSQSLPIFSQSLPISPQSLPISSQSLPSPFPSLLSPFPSLPRPFPSLPSPFPSLPVPSSPLNLLSQGWRNWPATLPVTHSMYEHLGPNGRRERRGLPHRDSLGIRICTVCYISVLQFLQTMLLQCCCRLFKSGKNRLVLMLD